MKATFLSKLRPLLTPEETQWAENSHSKALVLQKKNNIPSFSTKAIFWAAISIICALIIGQLN